MEAPYNPEENRGIAEDIMTRALAPSLTKLISLKIIN